MTLLAAGIVQAIVQATLLLSASALLLRGLIWLSRSVSANVQRIAWCLVLVQGMVLVPLSLRIPWYASSPTQSATTDASPGPASDLNDNRPRGPYQPMTSPLPRDPSVSAAAGNFLSAEANAARTRPGWTDGPPYAWLCALVLWGIGMATFAAAGMWRYVRFVRRLRTVESPETDWAIQWRQMLASRGVSRDISFRVTHDVGPALVRLPSGYEVVVPEAAWRGLTADQRRLILRHELAHYEHGDLWRTLGVRLLALPHWFNPLSWWATRKFDECTEWLCDRAAARASSGASAIEYARALVQLGSSSLQRTSWVGAAQGGRLFHRIQRLLSSPFSEDSRMKRTVVISAALGLLLVGSVRIHLVAKQPAGTGPAAGAPAAQANNADKNKGRLDKAAEKPKQPLADLSAFPDEPAAHATFDRMIKTLQEAKSLSYRCRSTLVHDAKQSGVTDCYHIWLKKPNYCRVESDLQVDDPKLREFMRNRGSQSVLVGDGKTFWVYWPKGRPLYNCEYPDVYEKTRLTSYLKDSATSNKVSLWEEIGHMGAGHPCFDLSLFHGRRTTLQWSFDAVRGRGAEKVGGEECDKIEVVAFDSHRWTFWLARTDHLPRKVEYLFHVNWVKNPYDQAHVEQWSDVTLNSDMPDTLFAWQPPQGWTEWRFPDTSKAMLKPGAMAPDFRLASADGKPIQLSEYRGRPVWLCFWAASPYPASTPDGKVGGRYDLKRIQKIYSQYKDSGLVVLGYNATDNVKRVRDTMRANGITFPTVADTSEEARRIRSQGYKMDGYEAKDYLIDGTGKIVASFYDQDEDEELFLEKAEGALRQLGDELGASSRRQLDAKFAKSADEVSAAAQRLFQAIREADYNKDWTKPKNWEQFPAKDVEYCVDHNYPGWAKWICQKFKTNPIVDVQLGKVVAGSKGRPTIHFRLTLKDGEILQGDLPFIHGYHRGQRTWMGFEALDWHLEKRPADSP
jgi:beta-lactamase regulating signal transducer with metallopeptidase domain/peroxiredoxin/outer membrane lipoprotein-sorting protein